MPCIPRYPPPSVAIVETCELRRKVLQQAHSARQHRRARVERARLPHALGGGCVRRAARRPESLLELVEQLQRQLALAAPYAPSQHRAICALRLQCLGQ